MTEQLKEHRKSNIAKQLASNLLALSLFALAGSVVYFTTEITQ